RADSGRAVIDQRERPLETARGRLLRGEDQVEPVARGDGPGRPGVVGRGGGRGAVVVLELDGVVAEDAGGDEREAGVEAGGSRRREADLQGLAAGAHPRAGGDVSGGGGALPVGQVHTRRRVHRRRVDGNAAAGLHAAARRRTRLVLNAQGGAPRQAGG